MASFAYFLLCCWWRRGREQTTVEVCGSKHVISFHGSRSPRSAHNWYTTTMETRPKSHLFNPPLPKSRNNSKFPSSKMAYSTLAPSVTQPSSRSQETRGRKNMERMHNTVNVTNDAHKADYPIFFSSRFFSWLHGTYVLLAAIWLPLRRFELCWYSHRNIQI